MKEYLKNGEKSAKCYFLHVTTMVNILARNAYLCPSPEICEVLFMPHFSRCFAIMRVRKFTKLASLRLKIVKYLIRINFCADKFSRTLYSENFRAARSNPDKTLENDPKIGAFEDGNENFQV